MKITKIELFHVKPRWLFLKMSTDEGITGWGEPVVEGRAQTVETAVKELESILIGADPRKIEDLWQTMFQSTFYRGGPVLVSAISGVEQALWDIKGKYYGLPIYEMIGGKVRDKIRMYSHIKKFTEINDETICQAVDSAQEMLAKGYTAMKYSIYPPIQQLENKYNINKHIKLFAAIKHSIGDKIDLALDLHGRVNPAVAKRVIKEIEPLYPMFIEEPCLPENSDMLADIARSTSVPIATGERLFTKYAFTDIIKKNAASIIQPDLCHCGGIFEARKIAVMAELNYASIAPHNPLGPISLASCIQLDACTPNFVIQEFLGLDNEWELGSGYLHQPFVINDGYILVNNKPGLGIEINEDIVRERSFNGNWETPRLRHNDGSYANW